MKKKILALCLASVLALGALVGCGQDNSKDNAQAASERPTTDMADRAIDLPEEINSIYSTSPIGTNLVYTFDDKLVTGVNVQLSDEEKMYMTDYYKNLPNLGGWFGKGNEGNVEEIIKAAPDIILSGGNVDQQTIDQADQLQKQIGIPVIIIDTSFDKMAETYRFLGKLVNNESRGEELAKYTEETIANAEKITKGLSDKEKVTVYYAEEKLGLNTDPSGSEHSRLIDLCGGINVADCEMTPGYGRTEVSMEQVIAWNPQCIISCVDNGFADSGSYNTILTDSRWSVIKAVKDGRVYETPSKPQNWFDRPPSVNTIIGVKWVQAILYPDKVDYDIKKETKDFYSLFYHYDLTDDEVDELLANSLGVEK